MGITGAQGQKQITGTAENVLGLFFEVMCQFEGLKVSCIRLYTVRQSRLKITNCHVRPYCVQIGQSCDRGITKLSWICQNDVSCLWKNCLLETALGLCVLDCKVKRNQLD